VLTLIHLRIVSQAIWVIGFRCGGAEHGRVKLMKPAVKWGGILHILGCAGLLSFFRVNTIPISAQCVDVYGGIFFYGILS